MATTAITHTEDQNRRKGAITSFFIHLALLAIALLPLMTFPDPPPGQEGILVALGEPDEGQGDEKPASSPDEAEPVVEEEPVEEEPEPKPVVEEPKKPEIKKEEPKKEPSKNVNTDDNSRELALKKEKERKEKADKLAKEKADAKKKAEADAKKRAEADAKRKAAEAEARRKAEADAAKKAKEAEAQKLKDAISGAFNSGQGNKDKPGTQGDPNGDPNASKLDGITTGSGTIGGGLGDRGGNGPKITDNSQETGKVVVYVCVNADGKVISARFTQKGSTATSSRLKDLAIANAEKYTFSKGSIDKQCGTITYDFKVK